MMWLNPLQARHGHRLAVDVSRRLLSRQAATDPAGQRAAAARTCRGLHAVQGRTEGWRRGRRG
ncbi:hypothetical protein ACU4GD_34495 [Cupriavidus basilensis]